LDRVRVLFVCTGNICRSPTAEGVLRALAGDAGLADRIEVDSAGTHGYHVGDPPDPRAVERARLRGYDLSGLRARQFEVRDFEDFDLIVAMDRGHHGLLLSLCRTDWVARLHLFQDFAAEAGPRDIPDPYYGGIADYDLALDLIEPGAAALLEALKRDFL
jgi:protein-tyrosine phosphatase